MVERFALLNDDDDLLGNKLRSSIWPTEVAEMFIYNNYVTLLLKDYLYLYQKYIY